MSEVVGERDDFGLESTDFEDVAAESGQETSEGDEALTVEENLMQQLIMNTVEYAKEKESKEWFRGFDRSKEDERDGHT